MLTPKLDLSCLHEHNLKMNNEPPYIGDGGPSDVVGSGRPGSVDETSSLRNFLDDDQALLLSNGDLPPSTPRYSMCEDHDPPLATGKQDG